MYIRYFHFCAKVINFHEDFVQEHHLERRSVKWGKADRFACQDFPRLFEEDLLRITLGVY